MSIVGEVQEFQKFLQRTRALSQQRNLKLEGVLNARDLSTCEQLDGESESIALGKLSEERKVAPLALLF